MLLYFVDGQYDFFEDHLEQDNSKGSYKIVIQFVDIKDNQIKNE